MPTILAIAGFLCLQFVSSLVSQAEFSEHKIKDEHNITLIMTKLDFLIQINRELKSEIKGNKK